MIPTMHVPLGSSHPARLALRLDGCLGFVRVRAGEVVDMPKDGHVTGAFYNDAIIMADGQDEEVFSWGTAIAYKENPLLKRWLVQQNFPRP